MSTPSNTQASDEQRDIEAADQTPVRPSRISAAAKAVKDAGFSAFEKIANAAKDGVSSRDVIKGSTQVLGLSAIGAVVGAAWEQVSGNDFPNGFLAKTVPLEIVAPAATAWQTHNGTARIFDAVFPPSQSPETDTERTPPGILSKEGGKRILRNTGKALAEYGPTAAASTAALARWIEISKPEFSSALPPPQWALVGLAVPPVLKFLDETLGDAVTNTVSRLFQDESLQIPNISAGSDQPTTHTLTH